MAVQIQFRWHAIDRQRVWPPNARSNITDLMTLDRVSTHRP